MIHAGLYCKPGSLKSKMCAEGRELMYDFRQRRGIAHERCGKLVVATIEQELGSLAELERRGIANGLVGMKRLTKDEPKEYEPHVNGVAGVLVGETGIINHKQVTENYAAVVCEHGGEVHTGAKVLKVTARAPNSSSRPPAATSAAGRWSTAAAYRAVVSPRCAVSSPKTGSSRSAASTTSSPRKPRTWSAS